MSQESPKPPELEARGPGTAAMVVVGVSSGAAINLCLRGFQPQWLEESLMNHALLQSEVSICLPKMEQCQGQGI